MKKFAGMANDIKHANDQTQAAGAGIAKNAQDIRKVQTSVNELSARSVMCRLLRA